MAIVNMLPHPTQSTPIATLLRHRSGTNQSTTYQFTDDYTIVIIATGGYNASSITSGTGWVQQYNDNSSNNTAYGWRKDNVVSGESVTVKCNDRYGMCIWGIK